MNGEKQYEFSGKWITSKRLCDELPINVYHRQLEAISPKSNVPQNSHILFRKKFFVDATENTVIHISADDYYKLYINGKFVCQGPSAAYPEHYYYNTVDITDFLKSGENTIAVHTYYQGLINRVWVSGDGRHGLICDILQGESLLLCSDDTFLYSYHKGFSAIGKFGYETQFAERYTSGTESEGFELPEYDDSNWQSAEVRRFTDYKLFPQPTKMLEFEKIKPISVEWDANGVTCDFGAIYVGTLLAEAEGSCGSCVELLFGQELDDGGNVRWNIRANCDYREEWVLSGKHDILNQFDYKSFRYVRINAPCDTVIKSIYLLLRHYPFKLNAQPKFTDGKLFKAWQLCVNTLKYGVQEVIQDCMDREKGFYLGDGCMTALAYTALTHDASQLKRLTDEALRSAFINKGLMTCMCCSFMQEIADYPLYIPHTLYEYYRLTGDKDYLAEKYSALCELLDFYRENYMNDSGLLSNLDKWCVVEWPASYRDGYDVEIPEGKICRETHNAINALYIGAIKYLNKIAELIGRSDYCDSKPLERLFVSKFFDSEVKLFKDSVNSSHISAPANAYALMYGLFPNSESEEKAVEFLSEKGPASMMFFTSYAYLCGLKRLGREKEIYKFISDDGTWSRMLSEGATRTFEGWGKDTKWNTSLFHLTLSYPVIFLIN